MKTSLAYLDFSLHCQVFPVFFLPFAQRHLLFTLKLQTHILMRNVKMKCGYALLLHPVFRFVELSRIRIMHTECEIFTWGGIYTRDFITKCRGTTRSCVATVRRSLFCSDYRIHFFLPSLTLYLSLFLLRFWWLFAHENDVLRQCNFDVTRATWMGKSRHHKIPMKKIERASTVTLHSEKATLLFGFVENIMESIGCEN